MRPRANPVCSHYTERVERGVTALVLEHCDDNALWLELQGEAVLWAVPDDSDSFSKRFPRRYNSASDTDTASGAHPMRKSFTIAILSTLLAGCSTTERNDATPQEKANNPAQPDSARMVTSTPGFIESEAVRYDPDQDRGFHRRTGAPLATVPFSAFRLGFLNDIAAGPDGLYVTDTGTDHIYRISGGKVTIALADSTLGDPNGITWDATHNRFVLVPFGGDSVIRAWTPGTRDLVEIARVRGAQLDGVEILSGDRKLIASQSDSSVYLVAGKTGQPIIRTGGTPADIAVDTKRNRVALPFVDRNLVEILAASAAITFSAFEKSPAVAD